jgi:hypothetical protein
MADGRLLQVRYRELMLVPPKGIDLGDKQQLQQQQLQQEEEGGGGRGLASIAGAAGGLEAEAMLEWVSGVWRGV